MKRSFAPLITTTCMALLGIRMSAQPGAIDPTFNIGSGANDYVEAMALQPDGKVIVGGAFTAFNGVERNRIARLNPDGSLDPTFDPAGGVNPGEPYRKVEAIALQPDGKIIIGGSFTLVNGTPRKHIARLNADGSLDASFSVSTGPNAPVIAIALQQDGAVIVGGDFQTFNGVTRRYIVRLLPNGDVDPAFNTGSGFDEVVYDLSLAPDGHVLVGGAFQTFDGTPCGRVTRLTPSGSLDPTFNPGSGPNERVWSLARQPDGRMLVGGQFSSFNGIAAHGIVRLMPDGAVDDTFTSSLFFNGLSGLVYAMLVEPDGRIAIGGRFTSVNGTSRARIARLNQDGSLDGSFDPGSGCNNVEPYIGVGALVRQDDGKLIAGGSFTTYDGVPRARITRIYGTCIIGTSCDDGIVTTSPDAYDMDCVCTGPTVDCLGVPDGPAVPGTACDDGSPGTGDDVYGTDCICAGIPIDCLGVIGGPAVPGSACDDGDPATGADSYSLECVCTGLPIDCEGIPGGTATPGSPCDDGVVLTGPDAWGISCICAGPAIDCLGIPNGTTLPGTPCDDGLASTINDMYDPSCTCTGELICIPSQLTTTADPVVSCGAIDLDFNGGSIIAATEVPGANKYQFNFTNIPGQPAYNRNIAWPTRSFTLTKWYTLPLKAGRTYAVRVRASFDGGATWCDWGPDCTVKVSWAPWSPGMVRALNVDGDPDLQVYPNPTDGSGPRMRLTGFDPTLTTATLVLSDPLGQEVLRSTIALQDGAADRTLPLDRELAEGVYTVTITAGTTQRYQRLVISGQR